MSILKSVCSVHDRAMEHDLKLGTIVLTLAQVEKMYYEIPDPLGNKSALEVFLRKEHYMHDGVHLMWTQPL